MRRELVVTAQKALETCGALGERVESQRGLEFVTSLALGLRFCYQDPRRPLLLNNFCSVKPFLDLTTA